MTPTLFTTDTLGHSFTREFARTKTLAERLAPAQASAALLNHAWILRSDTDGLHDEVVELHTNLVAQGLDRAAQDLAKRGVAALLATVADEGFAWRDIARLVGVSVPAVRKWRSGRPASGEHVLRLARLAAFVEWLHEDQQVTDAARWLEVPLTAETPVTRMDLLHAGRRDLLVRELVGEGVSPEHTLDEFEPGWRERYRSEFEVFTAEDGQRSIRSRAVRG